MSRTVADAVASAIPGSKVGDDVELLVRDALGHGSTVAAAICTALGLDPHEDVWGPEPRCEDCGNAMDGPDPARPEGSWWCDCAGGEE